MKLKDNRNFTQKKKKYKRLTHTQKKKKYKRLTHTKKYKNQNGGGSVWGAITGKLKSVGSWTGGKFKKGASFVGGKFAKGGKYLGGKIAKGARSVKNGIVKRAGAMKASVVDSARALKYKVTPNFIIKRGVAKKLSKQRRGEYFDQLISTKTPDQQAYLKYLKNPRKVTNPQEITRLKAIGRANPSLKNELKNIKKTTKSMDKDIVKVSKLPDSHLKTERLNELKTQRELASATGSIDKKKWKEIGETIKTEKRSKLIADLRNKNQGIDDKKIESFADSYLHKQKKLSKMKGATPDQIKAEMNKVEKRSEHVAHGWYGSERMVKANNKMVGKLDKDIAAKYTENIQKGMLPKEALGAAKREKLQSTTESAIKNSMEIKPNQSSVLKETQHTELPHTQQPPNQLAKDAGYIDPKTLKVDEEPLYASAVPTQSTLAQTEAEIAEAAERAAKLKAQIKRTTENYEVDIAKLRESRRRDSFYAASYNRRIDDLKAQRDRSIRLSEHWYSKPRNTYT